MPDRDNACAPAIICAAICRFWMRPAIPCAGLSSWSTSWAESTAKKNRFSVGCTASCLPAKDPAGVETAEGWLFESYNREIKAEQSMRTIMTKVIKHNKCRMCRLHILSIDPTPLSIRIQSKCNPVDHIIALICCQRRVKRVPVSQADNLPLPEKRLQWLPNPQ